MGSYKSSSKSSSSESSSKSLILGFTKSMEKGSFGVLYAMIKGNTFPKILTILSILIEFCQLSSFGFKHQYLWGGSAGYYLKKIMSPINHPSSLVGYTGFTIFYWIVIGLLLLGFLNIWYVGYQFYRGKIANIWVIRTLRWFVSLAIAVLFIPITSLLLIGLDCDYSSSTLRSYSNEQIDCYKGQNLPVALASIILMITFSLVGFISSATYYEFDTNIKSRFTKPHARFDVLVLFGKLLLSILNSLVDSYAWVTSIAYFIIIIVLAGGSIILLPYNNQRLNQLKSGFYMTVFWISFMTLVTVGVNDETSGVTCYFTVVGVFAAFPVGYFLNRFYYKWLCRKTKGIKIPTSESADFVNEKKKDEIETQQQQSPTNKVRWGKQLPSIGSKRQIVFPFFKNKFVFSFFVEIMARKLLRDGGSSGSSDKEDSISNYSAESIERANNLYQCGLQYFPNSDLLWMAYCNFLFTVRKDRHIGYAALEKLRRMNPSFDVRFFIYQRDKEREQLMDSDLRGPDSNYGKIQDFVSYMEFKKLYNNAKRYHVKCLTYIKRFWAHLLHETVDLHRLSDLSGRIANYENIANQSYERLLALNPNSVRVLRDYSQFLEEVVKDKDSSLKLQKKAESVEEIMSKSQTTDFETNDIKNLEDSETEVDIEMKKIGGSGGGVRNSSIRDSNGIRCSGSVHHEKTKSESSKSKSSDSDDDNSSSSSSSKGRRNKYRQYQQSNAINKLSWLMIVTTACCIVYLIVILFVFRDMETRHISSYSSILSILGAAKESADLGINFNEMQSIALSTELTNSEIEDQINSLKVKNKRKITIMKNIHNAVYWGEKNPISFTGDNMQSLKKNHSISVYDIGSLVFPFDQYNRSSDIINDARLESIYNEPSVDMSIYIQSTTDTSSNNTDNFVVLKQSYNAWKAGNSFIESAIIVNDFSIEQFKNSSTDSDFNFLVLNSGSSIPNIYISIQTAYIESLASNIRNSLNIMIYVWLGIFGFLVLIGLSLFRPVVRKITREKIRTLIIFSLAPKDVVVKLSTKKIKMVSLDTGSERENLFDSNTDGDNNDLLDAEDNNCNNSKKETKRNTGSENLTISVQQSDRRPLIDSTGLLSSTTTLNSSINEGIVNNVNNNSNNNNNSEECSVSNRKPTLSNRGYKNKRHQYNIDSISEVDDENNEAPQIKYQDKREKEEEKKIQSLINNKKYGWDGTSKRNLNKKSLKSVLNRLHLSYAIGIFILFGIISMGLWVSYSVVYDNSQSGNTLGKSAIRSLQSRIINHYVSELFDTDNPDIESSQSMIDTIDQFQINHQSVPYFDEVRPLMEGSLSNGDVRGCWMLSVDQCLTPAQQPYYNDVSLGLDRVVDLYTKKVLKIIYTKENERSKKSDEYQWLQTVSPIIMTFGLDTATFTYFLYYLSAQEWSTMVLTSILAVSCVLLIIIYLILFRPFLKFLRVQHIHTLALLRLAPEDIRYMEISDKIIDED
ncbi:hypothetical protein DDB_G0276733 [Dictyostelium discoideum AX4]|uniref:TmcB/TmcC TPR repeats domain-containing protein n=1 Tax=Dictyostelium discoideum TaxID=44689 RepID=Q550Y1_DICDI|nr:hypothetical protein DDB_G0276733 [Dictyostelium discoideum AX4]EAL69070.1 hypothetical protein DDB_G0276733 [Dictyostelium discoideum AX4]|eukprot:XP_643003.1 hypothetical protein DDB_G0276733 [Dictyostelium discoideum AX4]